MPISPVLALVIPAALALGLIGWLVLTGHRGGAVNEALTVLWAAWHLVLTAWLLRPRRRSS